MVVHRPCARHLLLVAAAIAPAAFLVPLAYPYASENGFWDLNYWGMALLGVTQRRLDRRIRWSPVLARSAYGAFMVQGVVLIGLAVALRAAPLPAEAKALIVAGGGIAASFALAWLLIKPRAGGGAHPLAACPGKASDAASHTVGLPFPGRTAVRTDHEAGRAARAAPRVSRARSTGRAGRP